MSEEQQVEFVLPPFATEAALKNVKQHLSHSIPTVFIASYPKSGTTWMQALVYHILSDNRPLEHISNFSPFVETDGTWDVETGQLKSTYQQTHELLGCRAFNTHLLPEMLPESDNFKFIYVIRNGKDVAVSFYHHLSNQLGDGGFSESEMSFSHYFDDWCKGEVIYGNWLYHLQAWIERGTHHHSNVLYVKYEDLKRDLSVEIQRISSFLLPSQPLGNERISEICSICSFETMKDNLHKYQPTSVEWREGFKFLRKGEVGGDNLSLLTAVDHEKYEKMIRNRFPGGAIPEWFTKLGIV